MGLRNVPWEASQFMKLLIFQKLDKHRIIWWFFFFVFRFRKWFQGLLLGICRWLFNHPPKKMDAGSAHPAIFRDEKLRPIIRKFPSIISDEFPIAKPWFTNWGRCEISAFVLKKMPVFYSKHVQNHQELAGFEGNLQNSMLRIGPKNPDIGVKTPCSH